MCQLQMKVALKKESQLKKGGKTTDNGKSAKTKFFSSEVLFFLSIFKDISVSG